MCAVLMKKLYNSKVYYLVAQGHKEVNSSKNGSFRYEMIGETQSDMEVLEAVTIIYPSAKSRELDAICSRHLILNAASLVSTNLQNTKGLKRLKMRLKFLP